MTSVLPLLLDVAEAASRIIRGVYETNFVVEYKGPKDPVTEADKQANELIVARLEAAFPGVPVVAEESDPASFAGFRTSNRIFFVDPLDGTAEFVNRNGQFVVMIGLVDGNRAVAGVVAAPATGEAWVGAIGEGAFALGANGTRTPITVTDTGRLAKARVVVTRSHRGPLLEQVLSRVAARDVAAVGSAGLKGAHVAAGLADLYLAPGRSGKRWDACAVDALVTAAGGRFTDGHGEPFDYRAASLSNERGIVASNGRLHDDVLRHFSELREQR